MQADRQDSSAAVRSPSEPASRRFLVEQLLGCKHNGNSDGTCTQSHTEQTETHKICNTSNKVPLCSCVSLGTTNAGTLKTCICKHTPSEHLFAAVIQLQCDIVIRAKTTNTSTAHAQPLANQHHKKRTTGLPSLHMFVHFHQGIHAHKQKTHAHTYQAKAHPLATSRQTTSQAIKHPERGGILQNDLPQTTWAMRPPAQTPSEHLFAAVIQLQCDIVIRAKTTNTSMAHAQPLANQHHKKRTTGLPSLHMLSLIHI